MLFVNILLSHFQSVVLDLTGGGGGGGGGCITQPALGLSCSSSKAPGVGQGKYAP